MPFCQYATAIAVENCQQKSRREAGPFAQALLSLGAGSALYQNL
jgi:hypothetical protein